MWDVGQRLLELLVSLFLQLHTVDAQLAIPQQTWGDDSSRWYVQDSTVQSSTASFEWGRFDGEVRSEAKVTAVAKKDAHGVWQWRTVNGEAFRGPVKPGESSMPDRLWVPAWDPKATPYVLTSHQRIGGNPQATRQFVYERPREKISITTGPGGLCQVTWQHTRASSSGERHTVRIGC